MTAKAAIGPKGLNYDFDLPGGKIALLYRQATRNGAKHTNSVINGA